MYIPKWLENIPLSVLLHRLNYVYIHRYISVIYGIFQMSTSYSYTKSQNDFSNTPLYMIYIVSNDMF